MPDHVTQPQLDAGYRAIIDAIELRDLPNDLERSMAILGYTVSILLVGIKPEYRFEEALKWTAILLDNVHRGLLRERQPDA